MPLFDSHCHIHDERTPGGTDQAVADAAAADVTKMVTVGCDRATSLAALDVASRFDEVYATVGLHPHDASHGVDTISDLVERPGVAAIGEAGLDYFYDHSDRESQKTAFAAQIQMAHTLGLPLVIHTRDAWDDTFDILAAERAPDRTIFHCFTGGPDEAKRCLDLGAYVSFSGIVTFPSATDLHEASMLVPFEQMLVETDSPYLAPVPHRGKTNRPAWVAAVTQSIADRRDVPFDRVAEATFHNACAIFDGRYP